MTRTTILDNLSALADPTRSRILLLLEDRELTVGELCTVLQLPQSTVSRHLKLLTDDGWLLPRGEGTSRYYSMAVDRLEAASRDLWAVVRGQLSGSTTAEDDWRRAATVIAKRQSKMRTFFFTSAGVWDQLRSEMIGDRSDVVALLELIDERWVVGDLGCGTGHVSEALAPSVARVIAVDESGPMLTAARERLQHFDNVDLREGHIEALPIEDGLLDAAMLFLVAHFIAEPANALREIRRVLRPNGRLVIVDLTPHDRGEYVGQLGHIWQGFAAEQMIAWLTEAGFTACRYRPLPVDATGSAPALFVASGRATAPSMEQPD